LSVSQGEVLVPRPVPQTIQADLSVLPRARGAVPFSARLYAEPLHSYRVDVFGFPSLLAASWLWQNDQWLLVRHDKREARTGSGATLAEEGLPLRLPNVHDALGFLWGAPLPGYPGRDSAMADGGGVVRWTHEGEAWEARFDPVTGLCREARSPGLRLRYALHGPHGGMIIPGEAEIFSGGESLLLLRVRDWVASPPWKKDPFVLPVPEGYEEM
jgi:hypothetical protein